MKKGVNLEDFRRRYVRSKRKGKSQLLTELCDLYGYNRKYLLQFFNYLTGRQDLRPGRKKKYPPNTALLEPLKRLWLATDQMCSKRLKEAIPLWLPSYEKSYGVLAEEIEQQLLSLSPPYH